MKPVLLILHVEAICVVEQDQDKILQCENHRQRYVPYYTV